MTDTITFTETSRRMQIEQVCLLTTCAPNSIGAALSWIGRSRGYCAGRFKSSWSDIGRVNSDAIDRSGF